MECDDVNISDERDCMDWEENQQRLRSHNRADEIATWAFAGSGCLVIVAATAAAIVAWWLGV